MEEDEKAEGRKKPSAEEETSKESGARRGEREEWGKEEVGVPKIRRGITQP